VCVCLKWSFLFIIGVGELIRRTTSVEGPLGEDANVNLHIRDHIRIRCLLFDSQILLFQVVVVWYE
jgi:hypothetical protein